MTNHDLVRTLDAVANRLQVIALLATDLRRSSLVDARTPAARGRSGSRRPVAATRAPEGASVVGTIYRRQVRLCTICKRRLDTTAARQACETANHPIERRDQGRPYWIKYQLSGRPQRLSTGSDKKEEAKRLLREREHLVDKGARPSQDLWI